MLAKTQDRAVLAHIQWGIWAQRSGVGAWPNLNAVKDEWSSKFADDEPSINFYDIANIRTKRGLASALGALDEKFAGSWDTYYFGPLGSALWPALADAELGRQALTDIEISLGVPASTIRNDDEELLKLLAHHCDALAIPLFAYMIFELRIDLGLNRTAEHMRKFSTSIDNWYGLGRIRNILEGVFGISRTGIIELLCSNDWYKPPTKLSRRLPVNRTVWVRTQTGVEYTLGGYLPTLFKSTSTDPWSSEFWKSVTDSHEFFLRPFIRTAPN